MDTEWKSLRQTIIVGHHVADGTLAQLGHADAMNAVLDASLEVGRPGLLANRLGVFAMLADLPCSELLHAADSVVRLQRAGDLLELAWSRSSEA